MTDRWRFLLPFFALLPAAPVAIAAAAAKTLTIERIFANPALSGPSLRGLQVSPAGDRVTYLRGKDENQEQLDLWEYHIADAKQRLLVDSRLLLPDEGELSAEEKARRERRRIAAFNGIVEYRWSDDGRYLLFPLGGDIYLYDLQQTGAAAVRRVTATESFETDPKIAPDGSKVAYVRAQDLYLTDIAAGSETRLTHDGGGAIKNGMAEFIAQEEMGRDSGYWWSPDSRYIAFLRVDETPVPITRRFEIEADDIRIVDQRYPFAGAANARLQLGVVDTTDGAMQWLDLGSEPDIYIPRVAWLPDDRRLSIMRQSRDQRTLELLIADLDDDAAPRVVLRETADTWVALSDDLRFLHDEPAFIWSSERSGFHHLYLYDLNGKMLRPLTSGAWQVDELEGVDEVGGFVYFTAAEAGPVERQLYRQRLNTATPGAVERLTAEAGTHDITMDENAKIYLDTYSSREQPPRVGVYRASGERLTWLSENRVEGGHPYAPYRDQHQPTEFGTIPADDGQTLYYRLTKPLGFDAARRYPVFYYVYGGPTGQTVIDAWDRRLLFDQYMAQHGFVVFSLDNRGTPRRGMAFQAPIYRRLGTVEVRDFHAGVEFLRHKPWVDADRIGLFGWSYGGFSVLVALLKDPGTYALGVAVAPVTDWRLYDTHYTERYLGTPGDNPEGYAASNVLAIADQLADSLLLIHGMADDNVLFSNSTSLMKALQDHGKLFDLMTYPGAKHGISGQTAQTHVFRLIAEYFQRHLTK